MIYPNHTYVNLTDVTTIRLLDKYTPALSKIPLSVLIDNALTNGASTFLALTDTPAAYTGQTGKGLAVNGGETALAFIDLAIGDMTKLVYDTNDDGTVDSADSATDANGLQGFLVTAPLVGDNGKALSYNHAGGTLDWSATSMPTHFGNIWNVDYNAVAGGDGSVWSPFDSVTLANAAAAVGDLIQVASTGDIVVGKPLTLEGGKFYKFEPDFVAGLITLDVSVSTLPIFVEASKMTIKAPADAPICVSVDDSVLIFFNSYLMISHAGPTTATGFHLPAGLGSNASVSFINTILLADLDGASADVKLVHCESALGGVSIAGRAVAGVFFGGIFMKLGVLTSDEVAIDMVEGTLYIVDAQVTNISATNYTIQVAGAANAYIDGHVTNGSSGQAILQDGATCSLLLGKNAWVESLGGTTSLTKNNNSSVIYTSGGHSTNIMVVADGIRLGEGAYSYVSGDPETAGPAGAALVNNSGAPVIDIVTGTQYMCTNQVGPARNWIAF